MMKSEKSENIQKEANPQHINEEHTVETTPETAVEANPIKDLIVEKPVGDSIESTESSSAPIPTQEESVVREASNNEPSMSDSNLLNEEISGKESTPRSEDDDEDLPKSSAENIIPLQKLKNGWFAVSEFVSATANKVKTSAVDAYNSEQVEAMKRRTSEVVAPAWEKTCEVAAPIWESTLCGATYAVEKTKEGAVYAAEKTKENAVYAKEAVSEKWSAYRAGSGKKNVCDENQEVLSATETTPPTPPTITATPSATATTPAPPPIAAEAATSMKGPPTIV